MQRPAAVVFDLDGTVYLGDQPLPGAVAAIQRLMAHGIPTFFLSNNPTKTPSDYVRKLTHMGITVSIEQVLTSGLILTEWLKAQHPVPTVFPIAEAALLTMLTNAGIPVSEDPHHIDYVIASFDRTFAYPKLQIAFDAIRAGARLIATNPDKYCPVPGGGEPDAAAIIAAIEACADTTLQLCAGKPSALAAQAVADRAGCALHACLMVGDRLETDIGMGATGMQTAVVMTGATTPEVLAQWSGHAPTYVMADVAAVVARMLD